MPFFSQNENRWIFPVSLLFASTYATLALLDMLKQGQTPSAFGGQSLTFAQFTQLVGLADIQVLERRYGVNP